jgi:hypothetical protein
MAVVLLTTLSYNCVAVMAQPEQLFAQGNVSDGKSKLPQANDPASAPNGGTNQGVTPEEMKQCMKDWDSFTQMSQREWADSCRRTLRQPWDPALPKANPQQ